MWRTLLLMAKEINILYVFSVVGLFFILLFLQPVLSREIIEKTSGTEIHVLSFPNVQRLETPVNDKMNNDASKSESIKYGTQFRNEKLHLSNQEYNINPNFTNTFNIPVQDVHVKSEVGNDLSEEISAASDEDFISFVETRKNKISSENANSFIENSDSRVNTNSTFMYSEHLGDNTLKNMFLNSNDETTQSDSQSMFYEQTFNDNADNHILQPHYQKIRPKLIERSKFNDILSHALLLPDEIDINLDKLDAESILYSSVVRVLTNHGHRSQHSSVYASSTNLNELIDFILQYVRNEIIAKGEDQIKIPDIHETFRKKIGFIKAKGSFDGDNGWFRKLSTIHRTGDVTVTRKGLSLEVVCALGLSTMEFGFSHYKAELVHIRVSGHMDGHIGKNSVSLKVTVGIVHGECKITLNELKLVEFGDIKVKVTGLGKLSFLLSDISTWAAKHFREKIVSRIEESLSQAVIETLSKAHCSESLLDHLQSYKTRDDNILKYEANK